MSKELIGKKVWVVLKHTADPNGDKGDTDFVGVYYSMEAAEIAKLDTEIYREVEATIVETTVMGIQPKEDI